MSTVTGEIRKITAWAIGIVGASVVTAMAAFVVFSGQKVWSNTMDVNRVQTEVRAHETKLIEIRAQLDAKADARQLITLERKVDSIQSNTAHIREDLAAIRGALGIYFPKHE